MRRWAGLVLLLAGPALADKALISLEFEQETILVAPADIASAKSILDSQLGPEFSVQLDQGFKARFASATAKSVGKKMTIRICGDVVLQPVIMDRVQTTSLFITVATADKATRLADLLNAKACPG